MKKIVIISLHIGYWLLYLLLLLLILLCLQVGVNLKAQPFFSNFRFEVFFTAFAIFPAVLGFYLFYTLLFDKFLIRRKILLLFIFGILTAIVSSLMSAAVISLLYSFHIGPGIFNDGPTTAVPVLIVITIIALLNGAVGLIMKGFIRWYSELKLKEELTQKNFEMELALVKSQISPHFLFNTLNNIDALITKNAAKASSYLNQLSDIMRFMLYETKTAELLLSKELAYIEKYIELHKIRTSNPDFVCFQVEGDVSSTTIAPMILIPFVENAFKHAAHFKQGNVIQIKVGVQKGVIAFTCENKYQVSVTKPGYGGLGNELIQRRLALLYPNRHTLNIIRKEATYRVNLLIYTHEN